MRVLLFSMPDTAPYIAKREWEAPSLGIASVAGNLDKRHEVWVADLVVRKWSVRSSVRRCMKKYKPEIVGLSAMIFQYFTARKIARLIKDEFPGTLIALGGYHATTMRKELANSPESEVLDFIFEGEGDHAFDELLDCLEGRRSMETVGGLSYKQAGGFVHNPVRKLEDVREVDFPERDRRAFGGYHFYLDQADVMETSRGCLLRCNFCSMNQMYGTTFRTFSIDRVLADIEDMYRRGTRHVFILDDNITLDVPRLMDLCDGIIGMKRPKMQFVIQASSAGIAKDPALPRKLADAGITQVFLGIENASEDNLMQMKKGKIVGVTRLAVNRLMDEGIIVAGGMIVGMADDNVADIRRNYEYFTGMGIRIILDQIMTPYPGTEMRSELIAGGMVTNPYDYKWYNGYWPQVRTKYLSSKQLLFEKWKARRAALGVWYANGEYAKNYPCWAWFWNNVLRRIILLNEKRMLAMYGEKGRFMRQMNQWARLNDFFGDMHIDPSFFDPDVEGPEGIGEPGAEEHYGTAPAKDNTEKVFISTRESRWSQNLLIARGRATSFRSMARYPAPMTRDRDRGKEQRVARSRALYRFLVELVDSVVVSDNGQDEKRDASTDDDQPDLRVRQAGARDVAGGRFRSRGEPSQLVIAQERNGSFERVVRHSQSTLPFGVGCERTLDRLDVLRSRRRRLLQPLLKVEAADEMARFVGVNRNCWHRDRNDERCEENLRQLAWTFH